MQQCSTAGACCLGDVSGIIVVVGAAAGATRVVVTAGIAIAAATVEPGTNSFDCGVNGRIIGGTFFAVSKKTTSTSLAARRSFDEARSIFALPVSVALDSSADVGRGEELAPEAGAFVGELMPRTYTFRAQRI
jgi:hypothetical protein